MPNGTSITCQFGVSHRRATPHMAMGTSVGASSVMQASANSSPPPNEGADAPDCSRIAVLPY